jgi:hypothetical protein
VKIARLLLAAPLLLLPACFFPSEPSQSSYTRSSRGAAGDDDAQPKAVKDYHNPAFDKSKDDLEQAITEHTKGFTAEGAPIKGTLDGFEPVPLKLKRGKCYKMVIRLADDAEYSKRAKKGISFVYAKVDGYDVNGGPGIVGPGGVASAGCPQHDAAPVFDIQAIWGSATDKSKIHHLGKGGFTAQLYSKSVSDKELAARQADTERQIKESEEFAQQEKARAQQRVDKACNRCGRERTDCIADFRRGASRETCRREYDSCLFREGGSAATAACRD